MWKDETAEYVLENRELNFIIRICDDKQIQLKPFCSLGCR